MSESNLNAQKKWGKIPEDIQQKLIDNVFCSTCFTTTIIDYTLHDDEYGIVLKGTCKTCGKDVARVVEDV